MSEFPLPPHRLPALAALLDGDLWSRWADAGRVFPVDDLRAAVRYIRLKPDDSCRITVFEAGDGVGDAPPRGFLLHLFSDAARARQHFEKEMTRRTLPDRDGRTLFLEEDPPAVGLPFPNDPALPALRHIFEPDRFRRTLDELLTEYPREEWRIQRQLIRTRLLAYKPGRRAVFRAKVKLRHLEEDRKVRVRLHLKLATHEFIDRAHANLVAIARAAAEDGGWETARICPRPTEQPLLATHWVAGENLGARVAAGNAAPDDFRATGAALARLHAQDLPLDHLSSPPEEADRLRALGEDLSGLLPDARAEIADLTEQLACRWCDLSLSPSAIVHGDLHPGQVIVADGPPLFVDLDEAGRGYAAADLGSFLAQLEEDGPHPDLGASFIEGYIDTAATPPDAGLRAVATAAAVFRRAGFPFRELRPDWPAEVRARLERCATLLGEDSP